MGSRSFLHAIRGPSQFVARKSRRSPSQLKNIYDLGQVGMDMNMDMQQQEEDRRSFGWPMVCVCCFGSSDP
jgi:hypothetical protein